MSSQTWNAESYARHARFVSDLGLPVVELLNPKTGERILDLGCGDGELALHLKNLGCDVVGADSSPEMVEATRLKGLKALVVDGENLNFENEFDAVFSNAALHWMKNPDAVITGIVKALRSGGRFVGEFGGRGNVDAIVTALHASLSKRGINPDVVHPWYFPSCEEYAEKLQRHGFKINQIGLFQRPTTLPGDVTGWLQTFAGSYLRVFPSDMHNEILQEVLETLKPILYREDGSWFADYVRLRFSATLSAS